MAQLSCAVCGKVVVREGNAAFPFCSQRCRTIDLGAWLGEEYRVPVGEDETERDGVSEEAVRGGGDAVN